YLDVAFKVRTSWGYESIPIPKDFHGLLEFYIIEYNHFEWVPVFEGGVIACRVVRLRFRRALRRQA
ncbi:MAG: hypothetical protein J5703_04985, partial [Methanomicrobium sp.]|nr:hypothetical protein [Methanomicrobium sp.]